MIQMRHPNCGRRLLGEAGFILPTAIIALLILSVLMGAAITVAAQTSSSTTRDDNDKAALAAAEAGIQVASYRLTEFKPNEATRCITGSAEASPTSGVYCDGSPLESLGNGATFRYWTSQALAIGAACAGSTIAAVAGVTQRCITAEGEVNGVEPGTRLQARVAASAGESLFSVKGIVGLTEVKVSGSVKIPGVVASNEKIIGEGSANFERGFELCPPKGSFTPPAGKERKKSGVKVDGVEEDPALEKTRTEGPPECPIKASIPTTHATAESNEDSRIGNTDKLEGTTTWSEANHELTLKSNGKVTLEGSRYYLCNFKATNNSRLIIAPTAKVEIFIDSPSDPAGKCKSGTGKFEGEGEFIVENLAKNPAALLIVMYGEGPFAIKNGSTLEGSIYGPEAQINLNGGTKFKGGIVGNKVHIENGTGVFEWSEEVAGLSTGGPVHYVREAWEQCTPGSGPTAGC
jgi:type II secretory pathway pseudopilin PulG